MKTYKWGEVKISYQEDRFIKEVLEQRRYDFLHYYPVIIDIGANIGTFSFYMYNMADRIHAIEPAIPNYDCLCQTIRTNHLDKIIPYQMAIGSVSHAQMMRCDGTAAGGGWRLDSAGDYVVDTRTLEDFMDVNKIEYADLVKIDVEGGEDAIFNTPMFPKDRIGTIIGELHHSSATDWSELFKYWGYKFILLPSSHFMARKI